MRVLAGLVVCWLGCAAVTPRSAGAAAELHGETPSEAEQACLAALGRSAALLATEELTRCEYDVDCRRVAALVSGRCDSVVNAQAFDAHLDTFDAHRAVCDRVVQVDPPCARLQPVCREGRCVGEAIAELPDECEAERAALFQAAQAANQCDADDQCVVLTPDVPATAAFLASAAEQRGRVARLCGEVGEPLYAVRTVAPPAACVEGKCVADKPDPKFTTVVHGRGQFTAPVVDRDCIVREAHDLAFANAATHWMLVVMTTVTADGRLNQFQFLEPRLSLAQAKPFAARLGTCRAEPGRYRGKPVTVRYRLTLEFKYLP